MTGIFPPPVYWAGVFSRPTVTCNSGDRNVKNFVTGFLEEIVRSNV